MPYRYPPVDGTRVPVVVRRCIIGIYPDRCVVIADRLGVILFFVGIECSIGVETRIG